MNSKATNSTFRAVYADECRHISACQIAKGDEVKWTITRHGVFTFKSASEALRTSITPVRWCDRI